MPAATNDPRQHIPTALREPGGTLLVAHCDTPVRVADTAPNRRKQ